MRNPYFLSLFKRVDSVMSWDEFEIIEAELVRDASVAAEASKPETRDYIYRTILASAVTQGPILLRNHKVIRGPIDVAKDLLRGMIMELRSYDPVENPGWIYASPAPFATAPETEAVRAAVQAGREHRDALTRGVATI